MTPARFAALCAVLNLGETRVAEMTGYSRGAVKNWGRGNKVWPPFAAWLERVAPQVQAILAADPPPNRLRPETQQQPSAEALAAALPPPLQEPREVRRAAIAAERALRRAEVYFPPMREMVGRATEPEKPAVLSTVPPLVEHARPDGLTPAQRQVTLAETGPGTIEPAPAGPPAMCSRCGRLYRTPTCTNCEGAA